MSGKAGQAQNILELQFKQTIVKALAAAIHDLVVSQPTFERDFDEHHQKLVSARRNLNNRSFESYTETLRQKHRRGIEARRAAR